MGMIGNTLAQGLISGANIVDGTVDTPDIKDSAVTTAKIADANVTTAKIVDANVTTAKIADANVTTSKVADGAITSAKIADSTIATGDIADGAITAAKLSSTAVVDKLTYTPPRTAQASSLNSIYSADTRGTNYSPSDRPAGAYFDFKENSTDGLTAAGGQGYHGVMTFRSYGSSTDMSGGYPMQLAYGESKDLYTRYGTSSTAWSNWQTVLTSANYTNYNAAKLATTIVDPNLAVPSGYNECQAFLINGNSPAPTGGDGCVIAWKWLSGGYSAQIYVDIDPTNYFAVRTRASDGTWQSWRNF